MGCGASSAVTEIEGAVSARDRRLSLPARPPAPKKISKNKVHSCNVTPVSSRPPSGKDSKLFKSNSLLFNVDQTGGKNDAAFEDRSSRQTSASSYNSVDSGIVISRDSSAQLKKQPLTSLVDHKPFAPTGTSHDILQELNKAGIVQDSIISNKQSSLAFEVDLSDTKSNKHLPPLPPRRLAKLDDSKQMPTKEQIEAKINAAKRRKEDLIEKRVSYARRDLHSACSQRKEEFNDLHQQKAAEAIEEKQSKAAANQHEIRKRREEKKRQRLERSQRVHSMKAQQKSMGDSIQDDGDTSHELPRSPIETLDTSTEIT